MNHRIGDIKGGKGRVRVRVGAGGKRSRTEKYQLGSSSSPFSPMRLLNLKIRLILLFKYKSLLIQKVNEGLPARLDEIEILALSKKAQIFLIRLGTCVR